MSEIVINAQGLSKLYKLGEGSRSKWLNYFQNKNDINNQELWAVKDLSFEIRRGEAVGIIGSNGAGKSTLLKLLSRVTTPTTGRCQIKGRVATILEVGTGFHPELTGRENIYLSGAILGMRHSEVATLFDEIVFFSGVEKFIDTPVKRYSSGMYVRLAFAVAAHLKSDIMIIDEVLAVGDVGFQKKCLSKMNQGINDGGRTILFVSHNLQAIRSLCERAILLDAGRIVADGNVSDVIGQYFSSQKSSINLQVTGLANRLNRTRGHVLFTSVAIRDTGHGEGWKVQPKQLITLDFGYKVIEPIESMGFLFTIAVAGTGEVLTSIKEVLFDGKCEAGLSGNFSLSFPEHNLRPGEFALTACLGTSDFSIFEDIIDSNVNLPNLSVQADNNDLHKNLGYFMLDHKLVHI